MRVSRLLRSGALAFVVLVIAACGGTKSETPVTEAVTPSIRYSSTVPTTAVVTLDGSGSTTTGAGALTYSWVLTSVPAGSTARLASPTAAQTTFTADLIGMYTVTLTVSDGQKSQSVAVAVTAITGTPPTILSDLVEPVSGTVQLSLSTDPGTSTVTWTVDGNPLGTGATVSWNTASAANGNHVVLAHLQTTLNYTYDVSRTFLVTQSPVSFTSATITESVGVFRAIVGAQSANGILRVDATLDGVALGTLAAPNACVDTTGVACASTGLNGYAFGGSVSNAAHVVVVTATDGLGRQLGTQLRLTVTDAP